jgi:hypothetical protein
MQNLFETIRSLSTVFTVLHKNDEELVLALERAAVAGTVRQANLRFQELYDVWACCWDENHQEWKDISGFVIPEHGKIVEAFVKPIGDSVKLSFSDQDSPLVRWGFTAKKCILE